MSLSHDLVRRRYDSRLVCSDRTPEESGRTPSLSTPDRRRSHWPSRSVDPRREFGGVDAPLPGRRQRRGGLEPLTLTRPVPTCSWGRRRSGRKIARAFGVGPGPSGGALVRSLPGRGPAVTRPAHGRQRPRLARPRAGARGQRPLGPARRTSAAPDGAAPGSASATASPPAPGSAPRTPSTLEPNGVDGWFEDVASRHRVRRRSAASGSTAPGTSSPRTPTTSSATSQADGKVGVSNRHLATHRPGRPGRPALRSTSRPGSTPTPSSTRPTARSPSAPASVSSRSPGSRGRATSAARRSSSAPTSAAA